MNARKLPDPWMREKVSQVIKNLLIIQEYLEDHHDLDEVLPWGETLRTLVEAKLNGAYHDLTKLLASACGSEAWGFGDREKLREESRAGLKLLIAKYEYPVKAEEDR
jgi:hypothetical protein